MRIEYTFAARQDLHSIYEYISFSLLAPVAAKNTIDKILETIRSLEVMPERNPLYKEEPWHSQGIHFVPMRNYLIFYTINTETETVTVSRIMFGGRDISHQLDGQTD